MVPVRLVDRMGSTCSVITLTVKMLLVDRMDLTLPYNHINGTSALSSQHGLDFAL